MPGTYTDVQGAGLVRLVEDTRRAFLARPIAEPYNGRPSEVMRLIALEVFGGGSEDEQLAALADLLGTDRDVPIERDRTEVFANADVSGAYLADLVAEVVCQVLARDPEIQLPVSWSSDASSEGPVDDHSPPR